MERLRPAREVGQDLQPADDAWTGNRIAAIVASAHDRPVARPMPDRGDQDGRDDQPDDHRDPAMEDVGRVRVGHVGKTEPFISGQSGKTYHWDVAVTCEPKSSSA